MIYNNAISQFLLILFAILKKDRPMPLSKMKFAHLADRAVLEVGGEGAKAFLQGLICNNIDKLDTQPPFGQPAIFTGLLTPQGKILFDFFVVQSGANYLIECAADKADELLKRLMFYRLRAKVDLSKRGDLGVVAGWLTDGIALVTENSDLSVMNKMEAAFDDPRLTELGLRFLVPTGQASHHDYSGHEPDYHAHRIAQAVPEGGKDYNWSDIFPHDACFDLLNGVDFKKGCYVGQEVVSKMHHKATLRKRFALVEAEEDLPAQGAEIKGGESLIGVLGSVAGKQALSLIRLDRAQKVVEKGNSFEVESVKVKLVKPQWANYEVATV